MDDIKLSSFKYAKCMAGGLHDGELLNLICLDEKCQQRGLICPVCHMESHENHYVMPLKTFLGKIKQSFMNNKDSNQLSSLGDYLRSLERSKKQLLASLKRTIVELSSLFKDFETRIEETYKSMRRNVLAQSSISTKLPSLVKKMTQTHNHDSQEMIQEFKKYCELIKYKDGKLQISDPAKTIVESFSQTPADVEGSLQIALQQFTNKIKETRSFLEVNSNGKQPQIVKKQSHKFSAVHKSADIMLNAQGNEASCSKQQGFVFLDKVTLENSSPVVLKVATNKSSDIMIAVCNLKKLQSNQYRLDEDLSGATQMLITADGTSIRTQEPSQQEEYEQPIQPIGFEFSAQGSRVQVSYSSQTKTITLTKLETNEKYQYQLQTGLNDEWRLCFRLGPQDKLQLENLENSNEKPAQSSTIQIQGATQQNIQGVVEQKIQTFTEKPFNQVVEKDCQGATEQQWHGQNEEKEE